MVRVKSDGEHRGYGDRWLIVDVGDLCPISGDTGEEMLDLREC